MSFQMHQTPGLVEQWSFNGHWVALADRGRTDADGLVSMSSFLIAFVNELESSTQLNA